MDHAQNAALLDKIGRIRKCEPSPDVMDCIDALEKLVTERVDAERAADAMEYARALWHR